MSGVFGLIETVSRYNSRQDKEFDDDQGERRNNGLVSHLICRNMSMFHEKNND
jgi:hypothetical protein